MTSPKIALCIATVGRIDEVDRLFASLEKQSYRHFSIYLADQNITDALDSICDRYPSLPLTRIKLPSRGVSIARNVLLSHLGNEEIIAFPDDDCWYAFDTLEQVVAGFRRHPDAGGIIGYWVPDPQTPPPGVDAKQSSTIGLFSHAGTCVQFFWAERIRGVRFDPQLGPGTGLRYGCGEDTDFLLQVHARTPVWRCPSIRVYHPPQDLSPTADAKVSGYAAGRMFLLKKYDFPLWFRCANVLFPLCMLLQEALRGNSMAIRYRWHMFRERLRYFRAKQYK